MCYRAAIGGHCEDPCNEPLPRFPFTSLTAKKSPAQSPLPPLNKNEVYEPFANLET
jgi:hypothetical protein